MSDHILTAIESLKIFWDQLTRFLPQLSVGVILFVLGLILAGVIRKGAIRLFIFVRLDRVAERAGIDNILLKGGAQYTTINILANFIYWSLIFTITMALFHSFGLDAAREIFERMVAYIPNMFVAFLALVFGSLLAKLVRGILFTYLNNLRIAGAEFISTIVSWAIILLVVAVTLQQLSFGGQVLVVAFIMAFGGLCLASAIAFGLAGKEWATQILEKLWRNSR